MAPPRQPTRSAPTPRANPAHPVVFACAVAIGMAAPAHAAPRGYASRMVGDWTVTASKDGKGCFTTRDYDRGTTLLLGLDDDGTNHLSVLNADWSIRPKDRLKLTFRLSTVQYPRHFAVGMASEGKQGFVTSFEAKFPAYFAASRMLDIARGDVPVERLALPGSGAAIAALRECVAVQRARPAATRDKAQADRIPRDPFAPTPARRDKR